MRYVSYSEISDLLKCERLWYYRHKLRLTSIKKPNEPLAFGIYGHEWLEGYYKAIMSGASIKEAVTAAHQPIIMHMNSMTIEAPFATRLLKLMADYVNFYEDENDTRFRILAVERKFTAPIVNGEYGIAMKLDVLKYGISGRWRGEIILEDHKFTRDFWQPQRVNMASQMSKYLWTINNDPDMKAQLGDKGREVKVAFLNQIRYRKMADHNEFFRRAETRPSETRINNVIREHVKLAEHAANMHTMSKEEVSDFVTRVMNKECETCDFFIPCSEGLDGLDERETLQLGYKPNEYGYND